MASVRPEHDPVDIDLDVDTDVDVDIDVDAVPPRLRVVHEDRAIDLRGAERAVADLLVALGHDPDDGHLADTPRRVAAAYAELLTPRAFDLTTFPNDEGYDELVLARDIPFQ